MLSGTASSGNVADSRVADPLARIHPADRKFYSGGYLTGGSAEASIQEAAEAADLKFKDVSYMEFLVSQIRIDPLAAEYIPPTASSTQVVLWRTDRLQPAFSSPPKRPI